jgi:rRNA maturation RNase YbeY
VKLLNNISISIDSKLKDIRNSFTIKTINKYKKDSINIIKIALDYLSKEEKFMFLKSAEIFLDLHLVDDKQIAKINGQYRNKKEPTNVLSFAYFIEEDFKNKNLLQNLHLGEIFISMETLLKESAEQKVVIEHHFFRLLIHGLLHLLGFDHNLENEARLMYNTEENILNELKLPTNSIVANYWR